MATVCIPKLEAEKLREGIKNGDFDIVKMLEMTSAERRAKFEKYTDKDLATFANKGFERAMISSRQEALNDWAKDTFVGKDKSKIKDVKERIDELENLGLLNPEQQDNFMEDLVAEKMGIRVTAEEMKKITEFSEELEALAGDESDFGTPTIDYFVKRKEVTDYLESIAPSPRLKVLTSIVGRGTLLASLKSPITNIIGNTAIGITESMARRMSDTQYRGTNAAYAINYAKFVNKVYSKSGFDISRMVSVTEDQKIRGERITTSQGKGVIRRVGRFYEDVIFNKLMGAPDVAFSSVHFADSANLNSTKIGRKEGLRGEELKARALEIFKDATRVEPTTFEGEMVREKSIAEAKHGTYTQDSFTASVSLGFREILNKMSGNLRLGDNLVPFAKIPANVVAKTIQASGVTAVWDIYQISKGIKTGNKARVRRGTRNLVTAGLGLTAAWLLASLIDDDDFVGEYADYNPAERKLMELEGATYDSIKIGGKWISADYFGAVAAPLIGYLNARKYGKGFIDSLVKYHLGVGKQLLRVPGAKELVETYDYYKEITSKDVDAKEKALDTLAGFIDFMAARLIPAIISDVAKAIDDTERQATTPGQKIQRKIPLFNQDLQPKINIFGEQIKTQTSFAVLAFGSRYKVGISDDVIDELSRLSDGGNLPALSNVQYSSSRVKLLASQIGEEKFRESLVYFGVEWKKALDKLFKTSSYNKLSDEEKKREINSVKNDVLDDMLKKFKYKKPKKNK